MIIIEIKGLSDTPAPCSTSATSSLIGIRLTNGGNLQSVHTNFGVVHFELAVSGVNHKENAINLAIVSTRPMKIQSIHRPVNDVSAILVATITFLLPSLVASKILACRSAGICE